MTRIIELLALFISRNAAFLEDYGNWIFIPLVVIVVVLTRWVLKQRQWGNVIRWSLLIFLFVVNLFAGSILFMANLSLKPMVSSIAKVQRNLGNQMDKFSFVLFTDNETHTLPEYKGKVVLLNFWATYCGGCIEEFPDLKKLEEAYHGDIKVIALSDEDPDKIIRMIGKWQTPEAIGYYSNAEWMNLESFRPVTVIIDRNGSIQECIWGKNSYDDLERMVMGHF